MNPSTDPWSHAMSDGRNYITPEDIGAAIRAGADKLELFEIVLRAVADGACEDTSCCAFVTVRFKDDS